jgi:RNA polymerase sigma factor (sigma-70 family)
MTDQGLGNVLRYLRKVGSADGALIADQELLQSFVRHRDEAAFAALVERHQAMVMGVCWRVLGRVHDVEDAFQATFLILVRRAKSVRGSVGGWLHAVAYRVACRLRARLARHPEQARELLEVPQADSTLDVGWREVREVLDEELQRLPEKYRAPLVLCYLEGMTQDEAARQLGWPPGVLRGRLDRGRERLRGRLTRRGLALAAMPLGAGLAEAASPGAASAALGAATVKAALLAAAGRATAPGGVSARVAALAQEVLRVMFLIKVRGTALAIVAILASVSAVLSYGAFAGQRAGNAANEPAQPGLIAAPQAVKPKDQKDKPKTAVKLSNVSKPQRRPDTLTGLVVDEAGRPISGAEVVIRNAQVRHRESYTLPRLLGNAYPECGQRATTDASGKFTFNGLSPLLVYDVLIVAKDYAPIYSDYLSPGETITLKPRVDHRAHGSILQGTVIDAAGRPVAGAMVMPNALKTGKYSLQSGSDLVAPLAVTDEHGSYAVPVKDKEMPVYLFVKAPQLAPLQTGPLLAGETKHELKLVSGATVMGTVLKDGKPVTGFTLLLVEKPEDMRPPTLRFEIAPNAQGQFRFENITPERSYVLFGPMTTCHGYGVVTPRAIQIGQSGTILNLGSIVMESGYRVSGKLVLAGGGMMPGKTRALIEVFHQDLHIREGQTTEVAADGTFRFAGLATDHAAFNVKAPGYHISPRNGSYNNLLLNDQLIGSVDRDISGLRILLEPGPPPEMRPLVNLSRAERTKLRQEFDRRQKAPLQGLTDDK